MSQQEDKEDLADYLPPLARLLSTFMKRKNIGAHALATQVNKRFGRASFIRDNTIEHWRIGTNKTTTHWQQLLAIAIVLELSREETEALLEAASKCPDLAELERRDLTEAERELLKKFPQLSAAQRKLADRNNVPLAKPAPLLSLPQQEDPNFTGREAELKQMEALLLASQGPRIVGLSGTGGMGKTSLAYHFAYTYRDRFPGGVIGLSIAHGSAETIARSFVERANVDLDIKEHWSASDIIQRAFSDKQALLIFDNVEEFQTVHALLPGGNTCAVIITTRDLLIFPSLKIPQQAHIPLKNFSLKDTQDLLGTLFNKEKVQEEAPAVQALYELVGGLPLAVSILGSLLQMDMYTIAEYVDMLRDERERLSHLTIDADDPQLDVKTSFNLSIRFLEKKNLGNFIKLFACLGACAQEGFAQEIAEIVSELDRNTVKQGLLRLYCLSLINKGAGEGTNALHPLLYVFARELAEQKHILEDAEMRYITYFSIHYILEHKDDFNTLEENLHNLNRAGQLLIHYKRPAYEFFFKLAPFLYQKRHWSEAIQLIDGFLPIAKAHNDTYNQAHLLLQKGKFLLQAFKLKDAERTLLEGKSIALLIKDQHMSLSTQVKLLNLLSSVYQKQSRLKESDDILQESQRLRIQIGEEEDISRDLNARGTTYQRQGKWEAALEAYRQSYESRPLNDIHGRASDLFLIGCAHLHLRRLDEALNAFMSSLDLSRSIGDKHGDAGTYNKIGRVYLAQGKFSDAEQAITISYKYYGDLGNFREQAVPLQSFAALYHKQGERIRAEAALEEALTREKTAHEYTKGQAMVLLDWGKYLIEYEDYHSAFEKLDASFIIEEALENERGIKMVLSSLIRVCRRLNRIDEARSYCRRALTVAPHNQEILNMQSKLN